MDNTSFNGENQASMPMQPIAQGAPKKQGGKTVIIAIIALLVGAAIASAIFICLNGGFDFSKKEAEKTSEQKNEEKKDAETTITDDTIIKELAEKVNIVLARGYDKTSNKTITTWDFNDKLGSFSNIKKSEKMGDIVRFFAFNNRDVQPMTKAQLSSLTASEIETLKKNTSWTNPTTDGLEGAYLVFKNSSEVKKKYQYVFGESLDEMPEKADGSSVYCGNYIYLSTLDAFVSGNGCGDYGASEISFKQLSYKQTSEQAYVYFLADVTVPGPDNQKGAHYAGLDSKNKIADDAVAFSDEDAYVKYRVVFDKQDNGNYAYNTVEEVKD